jgi:hypothetical protein
MANTRENDPKGARGGDTGETDQKGKGVQAEKGDQRREYRRHSGPTHDDRPHNHGGRSGSKSNAKK